MIRETKVYINEPISAAIKRGYFAGKKTPTGGVKTKEGQTIYYK